MKSYKNNNNLFPNQKHLSNDTFRMFLYTQLSLSKVYKKKSIYFFSF